MEQPKGESDLYAQDRMKDMYGLIERLTNWYDDVKRLDTDRLTSLLALGAKVTRFLETTDRIVALGRGRTSAKKEPKRE
jgi:DNA-binding transcriptional regulator GbsR (MarR family)